MKKFSFSLKISSIKINIKIINVFEFALIMIQNISKKIIEFNEKIAISKQNSL